MQRDARGIAAIRLVAGLLLLLHTACESDPGSAAADAVRSPAPAPLPAPMADADGDEAAKGLGRAATLGPFLAEHFALPIPAQGAAPADWSALERSLDPADCGLCHPKQYSEWRGSIHAAAYSPGLAGQLLEGPLSKPGSTRNCQKCHTPLEEQLPVRSDGSPSPVFDPELRAQGLVCAGCHVRAHARKGPPRRADAPIPLVATDATRDPALPHDGFDAHPEFSEARFCATCHQFFDRVGVNGKPVENTYAEWLASPQAARGETCQSCHMPERAHLWRGIHDPEMVRSGVALAFELEPTTTDARVRASLSITSHGVGHAFPTYVTPRVFLAAWQEDADGNEIDETRQRFAIGRKIDFRNRKEVFDTRVLPGETATLPYDAARAADARAIAAEVVVDPGFHYRGVFASLAKRRSDPNALALIREAEERTNAARYTLERFRVPLDTLERSRVPLDGTP